MTNLASKRETREDALWRVERDCGTMARANDSKRFQSNCSLSGHLARQCADATNKQVQARRDKLGQAGDSNERLTWRDTLPAR
jgi:hypothetical protein